MVTQKQTGGFRPLPSDLTDREWQIIQPYLPPPKQRGRKRTDLRRVINGIRYVLKTGCRWEDLPPERLIIRRCRYLMDTRRWFSTALALTGLLGRKLEVAGF